MGIPIRWKMQELIDEHRLSDGKNSATTTPVCDACRILSRGSGVTHGHQHFMLTMIIRGKGVQTLNGKDIPFAENHVFLLSPADFHCNRLAEGETFDYYRLCFSYEFLENRLSGLIPLDSHPLHLVLQENSAQRAEQILSQLTEDSKNGLTRIAHKEYLQTLTEQLLIILMREISATATSRPELPINRVVGYLHAHFRESINVADAALIAGYTPNYFNTYFRKQMGVPFGEYLRQMRLNYAENLLRSGTLSISEIAYESGFGSLSHFSRSFRKKHGCSPLEYRCRSTKFIKQQEEHL